MADVFFPLFLPEIKMNFCFAVKVSFHLIDSCYPVHFLFSGECTNTEDFRNITFHVGEKATFSERKKKKKKPELSCGGNSFQYYCFIKYIDFRAAICSKENTSQDLVPLLSSPVPLAECVTFVHGT